MRRLTLVVAALALLLGPRAFAQEAPAEIQYPISVVADGKGTVYIADLKLPGVWKWADGKLSVYFQASNKFRTPLNRVRTLALDNKGRLLAGDSSTREVYRFDESGQPVPLTKGGIGIPMAIAVDADGTLFVADLEIHRIVKVPPDGGEPEIFATIAAPRGVVFDREGRLWVVSAEGGKGRVVRFSKDGQQSETIGQPGQFQFPHTIVLDRDQNAYVADGYAKTIWKLDRDGKATAFVSGEPLSNPVGLAWNGDNLLIADGQARAVFSVDQAGKLMTLVGSAKKE